MIMRSDRIDSESYEDELKKILHEYEPSVELVFKVDIPPEGTGSCYTIAKTAEEDGHIVIMIKSPFDRIDLKGVVGRIGICGIFSDVQTDSLKDDDWLFLKHTLLHEISEVRHRDNTECQHDQWAFGELEKSV